MSLYGALTLGVAGLSANSQALSATSSNIANVNTVGYKQQISNFTTFLDSTSPGGGGSAGVKAVITQEVTAQGLPTATSSSTDMSVTGSGFFVVAPTPTSTAQQYTRAGSFRPDEEGNLKNAAGLYLLGWRLDSAGNVPTNTGDLTPINISSVSGKAQETDALSMQANLQSSETADTSYSPGDVASGAAAPDFQRTINVYDSQGGSRPLTFSFVKTGANNWAYEVSYAGNPSDVGGTNPLMTATMQFNSDGSLATADTSLGTPSGTISLTLPWDSSTGLQPQTLSVNLGSVGSNTGITQYDTASTLNSYAPNGSPFGTITGVSVGKDGTVTAQFSNGLSQDVYKIPLATFASPDGLAQVSGNAYVATKQSGAANVNAATTGSSGGIQSESLEASTVDLATEFTNLITTQRAYSASARIITTANQMLQVLENLPNN